jgi:hypothetical protein
MSFFTLFFYVHEQKQSKSLATISTRKGANQQKAIKFHERYSVHQSTVTPSIIAVYGLARVG